MAAPEFAHLQALTEKAKVFVQIAIIGIAITLVGLPLSYLLLARGISDMTSTAVFLLLPAAAGGIALPICLNRLKQLRQDKKIGKIEQFGKQAQEVLRLPHSGVILRRGGAFSTSISSEPVIEK